MKRWMCVTMAMAMTTLFLAACGDDDEGVNPPPSPSIELKDGNIGEVQEITEDMSIVVNVTVPGGVADFSIEIASPALTAETLEELHLAATMNLVSPATEEMADGLKSLGFPVGDEVKGKKTLTFDLSRFIPMIAGIYDKTSDHNFTLKVTDTKAQTASETLKFHLTGASAVTYNNDADLWANTATLSVKNLPDGAKVQYRVKGAAEWVDAQADGEKYKIAPVWESAANPRKLEVHTIKAGTGVFASTTYECRIADGAETIAQSEFSAPAGDKIPNADMSGWSTVSRAGFSGTVDVAYPNTTGADAFWDCGNNGVTTALCASTEEFFGTTAPAAKLASLNMFVLAAGNLFTGSFNYASFTGTVDFGRKYDWTARPASLKFKYKATVGDIDVVRSSGDVLPGVEKGQADTARVFVAIVDWTAPHQVVSAMTTTTGAWDPEKGADVVSEGKIIGYGSLKIPAADSDQADAPLKDGELEIYWYDKTARPAAGNYSLVISCACNAYGDYFTGCSKNVMYVDDFEWGY